MTHRTLVEKILSTKSGTDARVGDIVVCDADLILGTDGSTPMAIELFEQIGGRVVPHPERVLLSRDHYAPATSRATDGYHVRMADFATTYGVELLAVGDGIGFQVAMESGRVHAGDLVIGADSHTVTCGAVGAFATGIGSTDLAAALHTGKVWLRTPDTIRIFLDNVPPPGITPKDVALSVVQVMRPNGANYSAIEFVGPATEMMSAESRMVICNMSAETGAKAGIFPTPEWGSDANAAILKEIRIDSSQIEPVVALPHDPTSCVPVSAVLGTAIDWVFLGTCTGGYANDFREALAVLEAGGGIKEGVTVVVSPPSRRVRSAIKQDGTLDRLAALGAEITETGCGPCCGTSDPIPPPNAQILSTANRNFRGRMGETSASIYLASPVICAAAATAGRIVDPREVL